MAGGRWGEQLATVVVAVGLLVSCSSGAPSRNDARAGPHVIVPLGADGRLPPTTELTWSTGTASRFPASSLEAMVPVEGAVPDGVLVALRGFLATGEGRYWPQTGWRVLDHHVDRFVLAANQSPADPMIMSISRQGDGWRWSGGSGCRLRTALPEGLGEVEWRLVPDQPAPGRNTTKLAVLVRERTCASGQPLGERFLGPDVVVTATEVLLAFVAKPPASGSNTCPSNPERAVEVRLPERLGDRTIRDGLAVAGSLADYLD